MSNHEIVIDPDGTTRFIYSDALAPLLEQGAATIRRASHVEPDGGGWYADMRPSSGPVLGPFRLRQQALDAEVEWLRLNNLGNSDGGSSAD